MQIYGKLTDIMEPLGLIQIWAYFRTIFYFNFLLGQITLHKIKN